MDGVPIWLQKWAVLICKFIKFEEESYYKEFSEVYPELTETDLKIEAKNLRESKTSNVAITIDKVMHVLEAMNTLESPIKLLSF